MTPGVSESGVSEKFALEGPRSLYGMTKLAGELMIEEYAHAYGIRFVTNRCGLLAGPWQMPRSDQGVIALWMVSHYFGRPLEYIGFGGSGKQVRDVLHIDDFCELLLDQITNFDLYCGRYYNVGGGPSCSLSLLEATALCQEITGNTPKITPSSDTRPADLRIYISDHRLVSSINGWKPSRDGRATLESIYDWLGSNEDRLRSVLIGNQVSAPRES